MLQKQCSLLSHEGWTPWWDSHVGPTPNVRRGSIAIEAPKFVPFINPNGPVGLRGKEGEQSRVWQIQPKINIFLANSFLLSSFLPPSKRTLKDKHIIIWLQIQLTIPKNHLLPLWLSSYFGTSSHISQTRKYIRDVWFTVMYLFFEKKIVMYL